MTRTGFLREWVRRRLVDRDLVVELRLAAKMAVGGTAAWWLAVALGAKRPIFAALVPLVAMTGDPFAAVTVTLGRVVGVFAGVGLGIAFVHVSTASTVRIAAILFIGALGSVLLKVGNRPNLEVPIAALFMVGVATPAAGRLGVQRIWETAIGGAIAILVSTLLWPPDPVRELERRLDRLRHELVSDLTIVAGDLATADNRTAEQLDDLRAHSLDAIRDVFELATTQRSLRLSPLRRRDSARVVELDRRIRLAARVYRHTRAVARDVADAPLAETGLASATRDLADVTDRALTGHEAAGPLARAQSALNQSYAGEAGIVAAQLRQLHADLRAALDS
ncbi:MAG TPA: FUSC family protein [Gaiellaceae bacterium]|nr:FUSC family protein [Gaiellaceae bacterium]